MVTPFLAIIFPVEILLKRDLVQRERGLTESRLSSVPSRVTGRCCPWPFGVRQFVSVPFPEPYFHVPSPYSQVRVLTGPPALCDLWLEW